MIHPMRPASRIDKEFVTCDIENASDGTVLAIGTYDGVEYHQHASWFDWLHFIAARTATQRYRNVYAHNGSGWDWLSLVEWLLRNSLWDTHVTRSPTMSDDDLLSLTLTVNGCNITLRDSLLLFRPEPASLEHLGQTFCGRGKTSLDDKLPEWYYHNNREAFDAYLKNDCVLLFDVLCKVHDVFFQIGSLGRLGITAPSCAMKLFRTRFLRRPIHTPTNARLKAALRNAYRGGRVEVFRPGWHPKVRVYDVNSMYPSVMRDLPLPDTGKATYCTRARFDSAGVFHVRFRQRCRNRPPLLMVGGKGSYVGEGWYFTPELRRFVGSLEVLEGWVFDSESLLFREYVDTLYPMRMKDKSSALGKLCKVCLNSLYGKWAQKPERSTLQRLGPDELDEAIANQLPVVEVSEEYSLYRVTEPCEVAHEHVGIAGMITSEARGRLWDLMDSNTIYCDTDSIHTTGVLPVDPTTLGATKLEFEGEGVYAGKKLYSLRNAKTEKTRAKGVRVGGKMGCVLGFEDLLRIARGASVACEFTTAPTFNSVLRGGRSCTFSAKVNPTTKRHRRLRNTVDK